jgi:UDP-glucose 4-epimerase
MLKHHQESATDPSRVVVIGAAGFVGTASVNLIRSSGIKVEALGREDVDLLAPGAVDKLASSLKAEDSIVVISAQAPCKDAPMLRNNIAMMETVCAALLAKPVRHIVYISSDAVYGDEPIPLTEDSPAAPGSIHGVMHLTREIMLRECVSEPLAILRPTLIYGANDPHNGYGPNRFRRLASAGDDITLFGEGEERRDHVLIDDVAQILLHVLRHRSAGILNVATGSVASFRDVAEAVNAHFDAPVTISPSPRVGPMPHNGYRAFDPATTFAAFPDFEYTPLEIGLSRTHKLAVERQNARG